MPVSASTAPLSKILIRFIREKGDSSTDDKISITPIWNVINNEVSVLEYRILTEINSNTITSDPICRTRQLVSAQNLKEYLSALFTIMYHDMDPFQSFQLDMPNAPSVVLNVKSIETLHEKIMTMVNCLIQSWPVNIIRPTLVQPRILPNLPDSPVWDASYDSSVSQPSNPDDLLLDSSLALLSNPSVSPLYSTVPAVATRDSTNCRVERHY